jgi:hypothetical protein
VNNGEASSFAGATAEPVGEPWPAETAGVVCLLSTIIWPPVDCSRYLLEIIKVAIGHLPCRVDEPAGGECPVTPEADDIEFVVTVPRVADHVARLREERQEGILTDDLERRPHVVSERRLDQFLGGNATELDERPSLAVDVAEPRRDSATNKIKYKKYVLIHVPVPRDQFQTIDEGSEVADLEADTTQGAIYNFLADHPDTAFRQREIIEAVDVPPGSVSPTLTRLEERDLVEHRDRYWAIQDDTQATDSATPCSTPDTDRIDEGFSDRQLTRWMGTAVDPVDDRTLKGPPSDDLGGPKQGTVIWALATADTTTKQPRPWVVITDCYPSGPTRVSVAVALTPQSSHSQAVPVPADSWRRGEPNGPAYALPSVVATVNDALHPVGVQGTVTAEFVDTVTATAMLTLTRRQESVEVDEATPDQSRVPRQVAPSFRQYREWLIDTYGHGRRHYEGTVSRELARFYEWATGQRGDGTSSGIPSAESGQSLTFDDIDQQTFEKYARYLVDEATLTKSTARVHYAHVSAWCGWCVDTGYLSAHVAQESNASAILVDDRCDTHA